MAINIFSKPTMSSEPERGFFSRGLKFYGAQINETVKRLGRLSFLECLRVVGFDRGSLQKRIGTRVVNDLDENGATEALDYESGLV